MKLCLIRCTALEMHCQAFGFIMMEMHITSPGPGIIGMDYDDFTFGFIPKKAPIIKEGECNNDA